MEENTSARKPAKRRALLILINTILVIGCLAAIAWGIATYFDLDRDAYTNDAQVEEYISPVNVRIPGYIKEVRFQDHQAVKAGDTLLLIDDREYKIKVSEAEAACLSATASRGVTSSSVNTVHSNLSVADANIRSLQARLWDVEQNYHRFQNLLKEGAATQQQVDKMRSEYQSLLEQTRGLMEQRQTTNFSVEETRRRVGVNDAEIKRVYTLLDYARLNLSYTVITAPYDGVAGRRYVQEGQLLQAGQTVLSFVRNNSKWVVANYKETQVEKLHVGQRMSLTIDGLSGRQLAGRIVAISEATGARYSAIPVDNATGNFVKVQQRVPVKIEIGRGQKDDSVIAHLRAGMNVEVRIAN